MKKQIFALILAVLCLCAAALAEGGSGVLVIENPSRPAASEAPAGTSRPEAPEDEGEPPPVPTETPRPEPAGEPAAKPAQPDAAETAPPDEESLLRLHQISIGCADAYLLTVGDTVVLVDCGSDTTAPISVAYRNYPLLEYLEGTGIDHVDVHFVTHWHNDHDYNVNVLGELYGTDETVVYGPSAELYRELRPLKAGTYRQLRDGDRLTIGPLDVLCVGPAYAEDIQGDRNPDSLNFIVTYGKVRIMFTGDATEYTVARRWGEEIRNIDIFSFPHHGLQPIVVQPYVYRIINPRLILIPSKVKGAVRDFAVNKVYIGRDAVYLSARDGHMLVTTDGDRIWYAEGVEPGTFPLGEPLPPRSE